MTPPYRDGSSSTELPLWLNIGAEGMRLQVVVSAGGSRSRIMGIYDGRLKIQVAAPAREGQANGALITFLAKTLGIAKAQISIVSGASSKRKTLSVLGVASQNIILKLSP